MKSQIDSKQQSSQLFFNYTIIILTVFLVFGFYSCKKEKLSEAISDPTLIAKVKLGDATIKELTYNENHKVFEFIEAFIYKKYLYNDQNQLIKVEEAFSVDPLRCFMPTGGAIEPGVDPRSSKPTQYSEFEYDTSGKLVKKMNYYSNNGTFSLITYYTFEYNSGNLSKMKMFNKDGTLIQFNVYQINNGNITRDDSYYTPQGQEPVLSYSNIYEFDDKMNPFQIFAIEGIPGVNTNKNNIIKDTYTSTYQGIESRYDIINTYEYNELGYPIRVNDNIYIYN